MKYKGTRKSLTEIARELNVGSILEGSVRKYGTSKVRISVQLIDANSDEHLWSQNYDKSMEDVFSIQSEIAENVAEALKVNLLSVEKHLIKKKPTEDPEAFTLYLKGRFHWHKRTEEELRKSVECFEQAIEKDPNFALAYVGLAESYIALCEEGCLDSTKTFNKINSLVMKALEIDSLVPEAHATLASIMQNYHFDWAAAEKGFKRAIELNPNWADVCHSYAVHLGLRGRFEQAITEIRRAEELDPFEISIRDCAAETFRLSYHFDQAIEECNRMLELDPEFVPAYIKLGKTYLQRSMFKEGLEAMERAVQLSGKSVMARSYLAYAYGVVGRKEEGRELVKELEEASKEKYVSPFHLALAYAGLDDGEAAIQNLQKAYADRAGGLLKIKVDHTFDKLRSDPRFQELVQKIGLS